MKIISDGNSFRMFSLQFSTSRSGRTLQSYQYDFSLKRLDISHAFLVVVDSRPIHEFHGITHQLAVVSSDY